VSTTAPADPCALPAAASRAVAPRTNRPAGPSPAASRPTAPRGVSAAAPAATVAPTVPAPTAPEEALQLLRRLMPHTEALAVVGLTEEGHRVRAAEGRAWRVWTRLDGQRLADAAEVLTVLEPAGGAA
jgi:hypothetical protein